MSNEKHTPTRRDKCNCSDPPRTLDKNNAHAGWCASLAERTPTKDYAVTMLASEYDALRANYQIAHEAAGKAGDYLRQVDALVAALECESAIDDMGFDEGRAVLNKHGWQNGECGRTATEFARFMRRAALEAAKGAE